MNATRNEPEQCKCTDDYLGHDCGHYQGIFGSWFVISNVRTSISKISSPDKLAKKQKSLHDAVSKNKSCWKPKFSEIYFSKMQFQQLDNDCIAVT